MLLTTKGRYGLKALFDVALSGDVPISLKTVAARQGISESYLEILMSSLRKGGIVTASRGAQGGYTLSRLPKEITIGDVLRVLEGPMAPAECVIDDAPGKGCSANEPDCVRSCTVHGVLKKLYDNINELLDSMTLQDMLDDYGSEKKD